MTNADWPALPYAEWKDTCQTLQLWSQIIGKIRLAQTPWMNHSWQVPLYVTARGLGTGLIPYGGQALEIEFDFVEQILRVRSDASLRTIALQPMSVATFYAAVMTALEELGTPVKIHGAPNELPRVTPFALDTAPRAYDGAAAARFWRALLQANRVMALFRTGFLGKASPVHFFWGSFDLAVTRFSGRSAPRHPGGVPNLPDNVTREAYSHEVSSAGFWPGGPGFEQAAFYSYAYPVPPGFRDTRIQPDAAYFHETMGEFILPYETVCNAQNPDAVLLSFLETSYAAAANAAGWDRSHLECHLGVPGQPRPV